VIVPFRSDRVAADRLLAAISRLDAAVGDEVVVADNSGQDAAVAAATGSDGGGRGGRSAELPIRVVRAARERSSYYARNAGAAAARNGWLLFMDADCVPAPDLLDAYFAASVPGRCGAVAGQIQGYSGQDSLAARYARSRRLFDHAHGLIRAEHGGAAAGNLLVRQAAFEEIGGFTEGIRSGGDIDLCRRLRRAGWRLEFRARALVNHRHRETLRSLMSALARYAAGARWLNERYPGSAPRWRLLRGLGAAAREAAALAARGRLEQALFRAVDGLGLIAHNVGYLAGNGAGRV
jgi:GT2 family glycosyltransferase